MLLRQGINIVDTVLGDDYTDDELWEAACREADQRDFFTTPEDILREWNAEDTYDGYNDRSYLANIMFDCD